MQSHTQKLHKAAVSGKNTFVFPQEAQKVGSDKCSDHSMNSEVLKTHVSSPIGTLASLDDINYKKRRDYASQVQLRARKARLSWSALAACPFFTAPPVFRPGAAAPAGGEGWCWCLNVRRLRTGGAIAGAAVENGRAGEGVRALAFRFVRVAGIALLLGKERKGAAAAAVRAAGGAGNAAAADGGGD
eukprot:1158790-Pelagomonas_calceolata.AAC.17